MAHDIERDTARDPQDLERLLVLRQGRGDVDGMVALYEPDAILDCGDGTLLQGKRQIQAYFHTVVSTGKKYTLGEQRPVLMTGDLALTSTRTRDGNTTAEVARRQDDGTWLWAIDQFSIR